MGGDPDIRPMVDVCCPMIPSLPRELLDGEPIALEVVSLNDEPWTGRKLGKPWIFTNGANACFEAWRMWNVFNS